MTANSMLWKRGPVRPSWLHAPRGSVLIKVSAAMQQAILWGWHPNLKIKKLPLFVSTEQLSRLRAGQCTNDWKITSQVRCTGVLLGFIQSPEPPQRYIWDLEKKMGKAEPPEGIQISNLWHCILRLENFCCGCKSSQEQTGKYEECHHFLKDINSLIKWHHTQKTEENDL